MFEHHFATHMSKIAAVSTEDYVMTSLNPIAAFSPKARKLSDNYLLEQGPGKTTSIDAPLHIGFGAAGGAMGSKYLGFKKRRHGAIMGVGMGLAGTLGSYLGKSMRHHQLKKYPEDAGALGIPGT